MTTKSTNKSTATTTTSPIRATKKSAKKATTKKATKKPDLRSDFNWGFSDLSKLTSKKAVRSDGNELRIFANVTVNDKDKLGYGKNVEFSIETDSLENLKLELDSIYTQLDAF